VRRSCPPSWPPLFEAHYARSLVAERLTAQLLAGPPARDPVAVVERLLAVQGQDPRGARLAIRSRTTALVAADVDRALTEERSLLITWLNRGTLHLVRSEDYAWLHALTTPALFVANARRLGEEGVSPAAAERGVAVIERALAEDGPLSRDQLRARLASAGVPTGGQALVHTLMLASLRGLVIRGPLVAGQHAYVLVRDWLGDPAPVDREAALAELARRSLAGRPPAAELPPPRLLGSFDPALHGWVSREPLLGENRSIVAVNGMFRPFALVRGRAVATWGMPRGEVVLEPFTELAPEDAAALEADARDVVRFLGVG
jgi:hypothetical protein